jgi:hypothetical protein
MKSSNPVMKTSLIFKDSDKSRKSRTIYVKLEVDLAEKRLNEYARW